MCVLRLVLIPPQYIRKTGILDGGGGGCWVASTTQWCFMKDDYIKSVGETFATDVLYILDRVPWPKIRPPAIASICVFLPRASPTATRTAETVSGSPQHRVRELVTKNFKTIESRLNLFASNHLSTKSRILRLVLNKKIPMLREYG
jgi:hypothetical protein